MKITEMYELFQGLDELDKRGFFAYMSRRLEAAMGKGTFESFFKEYLELADTEEDSK
ncbi:hypothetical protein [Paenibacillus elgii]|uniref:hypothetical protein n=1 Tax=Paenibacillus elgii TaxID=189691 RepID=UPI000B12CE86|nr:hypothetical protein [Paenibacillus elgii]